MFVSTHLSAARRARDVDLCRKEALVEEFEALKRLVSEAEEDIRKAEGGNKAAGTRVRKTMQDIKNAAQEVRKKILELRDGE